MAPKTGRGSDQFVVRLPPGMRERLKEVAELNGRSMNAEAVQALDTWLADIEHSRKLEKFYSEFPPEPPQSRDDISVNATSDDEVEEWLQATILSSPKDVDRFVEKILQDTGVRLRAGMLAALGSKRSSNDPDS